MRIKPSHNRCVRLIKLNLGRVLDKVLLLDNILSSYKSQVFSIQTSNTQGNEHKHLIIYARFSESPHLTQNEWELVNTLVESKSEVIVVSNSLIDTSEVDKIVDQLKASVLIRENTGRDFGAFRDGLVFRGTLDSYSSLLLINNSMVWDCEKLPKILQLQVNLMDGDLIGLTDSFQRSYHLQSYFLYFKGDKWKDFISREILNWKNWHFKRSIVEYGERGLSKRALKYGLELEAVFPYSKLSDSSEKIEYLQNLKKLQINLNPTQHFWEALSANSFPGVKISLLETNPARLPKVPIDPRSTI